MYKRIFFPLFAFALVVGYAAPVAAVAPDPVSPLDVTVSGTTITATWGASATAVDYEVILSGPTSDSQVTTGTSFSFTNVLAGEYTVGVDARNADGSLGPVTQPATVVAAAPSAPTNVVASVSGQTVSVVWGAPGSNGGSPVLDYTVSVGGVSQTVTGTSASFPGLAAGSYTASVTARNSVGSGPAGTSNSVTVAAPVTVPGMPTNVVASVSGQTVSVVWGAPGSNGGSPVLDYTVSVGGVSQTVTGTSASFPGLAAGSYTASVTARNSVGSGPAGTSNSVTVAAPAAVPGTPGDLTATPAGQGVAVSWSEPAANGSPIIEYQVTLNGSVSTVDSSPASFPDLAPGNYTVSVAAVNGVGTGPAAGPEPFTIVAPVTLPGEPGSVTASVSGQTITVNWAAPSTGGDPNPLNYTVSIAGVGSKSTTSTSIEFTGVPAGTYSASVTATNSAGTGGAGTSNNVSVFTLPGKVGNLSAGAEGSSIIVVWNAPTVTGNRPITGYQVRLEQNGAVLSTQDVGATTTGARFDGRSPGNYNVVVSARNDQGTGAGAAVNVQVGATTPSAPANVSATAAFQTVTVTWDPPLTVGNTALSGYRVNIGEITQTVGAGTRSVVFSSVPEGTYVAQVWAINGGGEGIPGESESFKTETVYAPFVTAEDLISQQYVDFLGRPADARGLTYWKGILGGDRSQGPVVIQNFMRSKEFAPRRSIARLYLAFFDRAPDRKGFDYWATTLAQGASLNDVAAVFAGSAEFKAAYGELNDAEFIALVYNNVLLRSPDLNGFRFWIGRLQDPSISRGDLMVAFSESPEFVRNSNPAVDVIMTYRGMLDRAPDANGFAYWVGQVGGNPDALRVLIANFMVGQEYYNRVR